MSKTCTFTHPIAARNGIKDKNVIQYTVIQFYFARVLVQIIRFPYLIKPNFDRLCHYCATKNGIFCT